MDSARSARVFALSALIRRTTAAIVHRPALQRLLWVIGALALSIAPHLPHLALWVILLAATGAMWRVAIEVKQWALPPKWLRVLVAVAALLAVLATYRTLNGIEAGTALLVVMAGMKLLETRTVRDLTVIVFLAYFALFAAFLYNQELLRLPYMLVTAWLLAVTLMRIHQTTSTMSVREATGVTGKMFLQALPLAILLFLFFPRLPGQFWAAPARTQATTGLSDEMSPGDVSELSVSGAIAFRVKFDGAPPPPRERYWRGPVLHDFDGRTWRRPSGRFLPQAITTSGPDYKYRLTLEPHQRNWIFPLDVVTRWPGRTTLRTSDFQLLTPHSNPVSTLTAFELQSSTSFTVVGALPRAMRNADLQLPENRNPRSIALARKMRAQAGSDAAFIQAVLAKFRDEEYFYTLEPPRLELNSVDDFLFNTRRGFCEHFASTFTVLARAAGIPARVVAGYQGGEYNPMGDYFIVRQSEAHAWTEVWLEERGWVRIDPTAAVAPERIESGGLAAAMSEDEPVPGRLLRNNRLLSQLRLTWDAANTFWNDQVVEFGEAQQRWLLTRLDIDEVRWEYLGVALVLALMSFFIVLSMYLAWRFRPRPRDPVAQIYDALCRKLARREPPRLAYEGPVDYLARVTRSHPGLTAQLAEIRSLYLNLRYSPSPLISQLSRLKHLVNQLQV
ncbi:MAG: transglutaminase TgpA family protein [Steroidobacter sp.]